jgi:hypothetical protein
MHQINICSIRYRVARKLSQTFFELVCNEKDAIFMHSAAQKFICPKL